MPNHRGHANHSEVNKELQDFEKLVASGCSLYLRHFLCAYYAPLCRVYLPLDHGTVPPCRELCTHVREKCEPLMVANGGVEWPGHLGCDSFPVKKDVPWCFGPDNIAQLNEESETVTSTYQILATTTASTLSITSKPISLVPSPSPSSSPPHHEQYECMYIPSDSICASLNYTRGIYPNYMGHKTAGEAEKSLQTTFDVFLFYCSPHIVPLLCYYYHPQCADDEGVVTTPTPVAPPCQEMCSDVKTKCHSKYNDKWPKHLDCTKLPLLNDSDTLCKMADELNTTSTISTATPTVEGVGGASTIITMGTPITISIALIVTMVTIGST